MKPMWVLAWTINNSTKDHWRICSSQQEAKDAYEELLEVCDELSAALIAPIHEATEPHYIDGGE